MNIHPLQFCALPGCNKPLKNWRYICCCKSHRGKYSAKSRHGTLELPNKMTPDLYKPPRIKLTTDQRKAKWAAYVTARARLKDLSMSTWADKDKIDKMYVESRRLTVETGIKHEVDHIIPIHHTRICGLHNEFNLQILTKTENCKKSNKFISDRD